MAKRKKTARIHYGRNQDGDPLYWTVPYSDAKEPVKIESNILDALEGKCGVTIGCHLSNCAKASAAAFPHPCKLASFTATVAYIVDKITKGKPSHATRYVHRMGKLVEMNDKDVTKKYVDEHLPLIERQITLYAPYHYKAKAPGKTSGKRGSRKVSARHVQLPRGALKRAIDAGLIQADLSRFGFY